MLVRLRNFLIKTIVRFLILITRFMPPGIFVALCPIIVFIAWHILLKLRKVTLRNLELCLGGELPKRERLRLANHIYRNIYFTAIEFIYFMHWDNKKMESIAVKVTGWEHLERALKEGKGVIGLAMHYGNWEYSGAFLPLKGVPLVAVGKEQRDEFFTELAFQTRVKLGIENIARGDKFSSVLVRAIRDGKVLGLLADQNGGIDGRFVPFFNLPASTVRGPAQLALKFGSPLILILARRLAPFAFEILVKPPLQYRLTGDYEQDESSILTQINKLYEEVIREEPSQWLWFHKRFKTRPPGEPPLY